MRQLKAEKKLQYAFFSICDTGKKRSTLLLCGGKEVGDRSQFVSFTVVETHCRSVISLQSANRRSATEIVFETLVPSTKGCIGACCVW